MNKNPNDPTSSDAPWEEAMSRDFDARVRDLHEAPLDFNSVKGKARTIRRNRRAAVAGGILGVAAIVTPIAVLTNGGDTTNSKEPDFAPQTTESAVDPTTGIDYVEGRTWHQADSGTVQLPKGEYYGARLWNDKLVTLQPGVEVYSTLSIFDEDGSIFDQVEEVAGFAVSADGTILSYTEGDGDLHARWDGGTAVLATNVTDTGGGESVGGAPVSVVGTPPCTVDDNCLVRVNTYEDGCVDIGTGGTPAPGDALACGDENGDRLVYVNDLTEEGYQCGGIRFGSQDTATWSTCDYDLQELSPDGTYVVGGQIDSDGLGPKEVSVLDAATGDLVSTYTAPTASAFLWSDIAWTASGHLLVSEWDDGQWRLLAIDPTADGDPVEVAGPVEGGNNNPFLVIHH